LGPIPNPQSPIPKTPLTPQDNSYINSNYYVPIN
jgi:hypothetical protein